MWKIGQTPFVYTKYADIFIKSFQNKAVIFKIAAT